MEADRVSDGHFCAVGTKGKLIIVEGNCNQLDDTAPTVQILSVNPSSKSLTVLVHGEDAESGIYGYQYSLDNGVTWSDIYNTNLILIEELEPDHDYDVIIKAINGNNLESVTPPYRATTTKIDAPTYRVDKSGWQQSKTVTITYPTIENQDLIYEYSEDMGSTWETSAGVTKDITYNANGILIARVSDGHNTVTATLYQVDQIDTTNPTITSVEGNIDWVTKVTLSVNASDTGVLPSGLHENAYSFDNGATWQAGATKEYTSNQTVQVKVRDKA